MPKSIFNPDDLQALDNRLARLTPDSPRRFGKMTPEQMICHLKDALDIATGVTTARAKKSFMSNRLVRHLIVYYVPWPKGKAQTLPEFLATKPSEWHADLHRLRDMLKQASARGPGAPWPPHPAFGDLSGKDYGVLIYRHFNHHLGQFSV